MIKRLQTRPFVFTTLNLNAPQVGPRALSADLRVRTVFNGQPTADILAARVVDSLGWDPYQPIYFEATQGSATWIEIAEDGARLSGEIAGYYRRRLSESGEESTTGNGYAGSPELPILMTLALTFRFESPEWQAPKVTGTVTLESDHLIPDFGSRRIETSVSGSEARLFRHDLPARDAGGRLHNYFVALRPRLVQSLSGADFESVDRLITGAAKLWHDECRIEIIRCEPKPLIVPSTVIQELCNGVTSGLVTHIRRLGTGSGVPVAFVDVPFAGGGGETTEPGVARAIVIATDASPAENTTLLAHEIGHVCGGVHPGLTPGGNCWEGEPGTVMDATGDVMLPPPPKVGTFGCEHAKAFLSYRRRLLRVLT